MFDKFLPGLMPYRIKKENKGEKDVIFFTSPAREKGVGMAFPDFENDKVYIPLRIDFTYEYYQNICKAFLKINIKKYKLHTIPNQENASFYIILDKNNKIDYKQLPNFVDVLNADKNIPSKKSHKILENILLLMDSINEFAKTFESNKNNENDKINIKENWEKDLENNKVIINSVMNETVKIHDALQEAKKCIDNLIIAADFPKAEGEKIKESLESVCEYIVHWSFEFMTKTVPDCPLWNKNSTKE